LGDEGFNWCRILFRRNRVIYADVPITEAKADMNTVWQPYGASKEFIFAVLEENQISPNCEGCDWSSPEQ
jgi:hypothetical protein